MAGLILGNWELLLFDVTTGQYQNLTETPYDERDPALSPDGKTLAYSARVGDNWDVYLYDLQTGVRTRLTDSPAYDGRPAWSPDGSALLFESNSSGNLDIVRLTLRDRSISTLTTDPSPEVEPLWLTSGEGFIFSSWRAGKRQVFRQDFATNAIIPITELGEEPRQTTLSADNNLMYVRDGNAQQEVVVRSLDTTDISIVASSGEMAWPTFAGANRHSLLGLRVLWGRPGEYPIGWQLITGDLSGNNQRVLMRLRGEWEQPICAEAAGHVARPMWKPVGSLNTDSYLATLDPPGPYRLVQLDGVVALQPVLSSAVAPAFNKLRHQIFVESGYDYLGHLNDAWRGLDHPGGQLVSWHRAGRAFDARDWFATDQQRLYISREQIGSLTYFRIYILAHQQNGSQGRPLRKSLWYTEGRLKDASMLMQGGRYSVPPKGYFVDVTELATREGWTRIPALTPPHGDWKRHYVDLEFWHYERRGGLRWYDAMSQLYGESEIQARYSIERLIKNGYLVREIEQLGLFKSESNSQLCNITSIPHRSPTSC